MSKASEMIRAIANPAAAVTPAPAPSKATGTCDWCGKANRVLTVVPTPDGSGTPPQWTLCRPCTSRARQQAAEYHARQAAYAERDRVWQERQAERERSRQAFAKWRALADGSGQGGADSEQ